MERLYTPAISFAGCSQRRSLWIDASGPVGYGAPVTMRVLVALARRHITTTLSGQFAVMSFLVIGLITAALCLVISHYVRKDLLDREWTSTADFIRKEVRQTLTRSDFANPESQTAQEHFRALFKQAHMMPEIVRVKIYDARMTAIWSDEPRLVGLRFLDNVELSRAIAGQTTVNLESEKKGENLYETAPGQLVEVYVPITFPGDARVVGVVETYKEPAQVFANIRSAQLTVIGTAASGGALLYLSLFWIVRRATRRIEAQHRALVGANEELRSVHTQLLEAERMAAVGGAVTAVAHGIRSPLTNIRASAQVAALDCRPWGSAQTVKSLANITTEVDRLDGLLKEFLQFVRPATRHNQPVDVNEVVREAVEMMAGRIGEAHMKVDEHLAPVLPITTGDPLLLEQVFVNLISNAIEASPAGGSITLTTGTADDDAGSPHVFAEVRDTGAGIPPEDLPKIFDLFYTTKAEGTGLGLAIAQKVARAHGGTVTVRSRLGEGATVRVMLPAEPRG